MTYIAKCPNGCANFKGDSGSVWVKIDQDAYYPARTSMPWGENILHNGGKYSVVIPVGLANGEYILRHEVFGLHVAGNLMSAQFYPNCVQVKVQNGGSKTLPAGIALLGAYKPTDPGILTQLWWYNPSNTTATYVAPGGPVTFPVELAIGVQLNMVLKAVDSGGVTMVLACHAHLALYYLVWKLDDKRD